MATIVAKFDGRCGKCGCAFAAGTKVDWAPGAGASHAPNCPAGDGYPPPEDEQAERRAIGGSNA